MYTVNKTRSQKKIVFTLIISLLLIFGLAYGLFWYFIIRDTDSNSANFSRTGGTVAVVKPATQDFATEEFTITLPSGWEFLGKENPVVNEEYYYYQSKTDDFTNRWLKIFVDTYPKDYALTRLLPITVKGNKIEPGIASSECTSFEGAPKVGSQASKQPWVAEWEGISFNCNMTNPQNHTGTASVKDGYGVPITGKSGAIHKYFFVYIDHNIRPDYSILTSALKTFEAL